MTSRYINIIISFFMFFSCNKNSSEEIYTQKRTEAVEDVKSFEWTKPNKIISLLEPHIFVSDGNSKSQTGQSKYGGTPDLPISIEWPKFTDKPMVFFGQLNLADINKLHQYDFIPQRGMLYFFAYFKNPESEYGAEYLFRMPREEYKVIYFEGKTDELHKTKFPEDLISDFQFKETAMDFDLDFRIPCSDFNQNFKKANLSQNDIVTYNEFIERFDDYCNGGDVVLGIPSPIQDDLDIEWSYSYLNSFDYENPETKLKVERLRSKFVNLFSFGMYDRFESIGMSNCYFGITKEDLINKSFDKVIFVIQDT